MRRPLPPTRTLLRPRDPVGELLLALVVSTLLLTAVIAVTVTLTRLV